MPVKLSGKLVKEARKSAKRLHRSLTGQIEHWAALGCAIESKVPADTLAELLENHGEALKIADVSESGKRRKVGAVLVEFLSQTGNRRKNAFLQAMRGRGVPLYGTKPGKPGQVVRINSDGSEEIVRSPSATARRAS
jgi:hypothetical protein